MQREGAPRYAPPSRGTWRDSVLQPHPEAAAAAPATAPVAATPMTPPPPQPRQRRCGLIVTHCLDLLGLLLLAGLAAALRFGDLYLIHPQLQGLGGLCLDLAYRSPRQQDSIGVPDYAVYVLVILAPLVLLALLEVVYAFAVRKDRTKSIFTLAFFKRAAKLKLLFLLGLCLTSTVTDIVRLLASRPRPYFLANDDWGFGFLRLCKAPDHSDGMGSEEIAARLSFPSHRCTMLAFCGVLVAVHAERVLRRVHAGGMYSVRALAALLCTVPALVLAAQAYHSRSNHLEDIVVGLLLGAAMATYVVLVLNRDLAKEMQEQASAPAPASRAFPEAGNANRGHAQHYAWKSNAGLSRAEPRVRDEYY